MSRVTNDTAKDWVVYKGDILNDKSLREIFEFYILRCPKEGSSVMGFDYTGSFDMENLNAQDLLDFILAKLKLNKEDTIYIVKKLDDMSSVLEKAGLNEMFYNCKKEKIVVYCQKQNDIIISILNAIRCALAHGRFAKKNFNKGNLLVLENYHQNCVRSRIILKIKTLLKLKQVILGGATLYKKYIQEKNEKEIRKIKKIINKGKPTSKERIKNIINYNYDYIESLCKTTGNQILKIDRYYKIK